MKYTVCILLYISRKTLKLSFACVKWKNTRHISVQIVCFKSCNAGFADTLLKDGAVKTIFILTAGVQRKTQQNDRLTSLPY